MQLEIIYTFEEGQQIKTLPFAQCLLNDKKEFFEFATSLLEGEEKEKLVKMSCCIYYAVGLKVESTHWYTECKGKFWQDDINQLMLDVWAIRSTAKIIS